VSGRRAIGKRAIDIVVGSLLAALAIPVILLLAVGSAISLRAWPIFVQERVGLRGRIFRIPKLRTLPADTASAADKYALHGVRVPAFGRFLRRSHLDELPQLLLVPVGTMSLVGPRPEMPSVMARYPADFVVERTSMRPGCTCLWQLSTSADGLIFEAPEYDRTYLRHSGPLLDAWILYRTARALLPRASTIELGDLPAWACRTGLDRAHEPRRPPLPQPNVHRVLEPVGSRAVEAALD
jgi:lipopolysaccharide/colanic/teichoic acid biosynthesis glycosyltransferase